LVAYDPERSIPLYPFDLRRKREKNNRGRPAIDKKQYRKEDYQEE
jgi:hypothetical protein